MFLQPKTHQGSGISLGILLKKHPEQIKKIDNIKQENQLSDEDLLLLPIQGSQNDIIVIINKLTGKAIQYLLINPWNLSAKK